MMKHSQALVMNDRIQGTFHFHSTYSHDGKNTLSEIAAALKKRNLSFCVMTEHFEDFDEAKFNRYIEDLIETTKSSGIIFIPGMEVHLSGVDTILFPVQSYEDVARFESEGKESEPPMFKVVAHPSKYHFEDIANHLEKYQLDGIELWNQQADSSYIPPMNFLEQFKKLTRHKDYRYFFGCDLHSANLTVANVLSLQSPGTPTAETIANVLIEGNFVSRNIATGIEFHNGIEGADFDAWFHALHKRHFYKARLLRNFRRCLRALYKKLPRDTQYSLNDFKNFVRNKV
jgi:hypothetical protein